MAGGHCLKSYRVGDQKILALARASTGKSCVDDLISAHDPNDVLKMSIRSILAIQNHGMRYAIEFSLVRRLSKGVYLVEFKSRGTAWRMAAYIYEERASSVTPVLLGCFKGHGGKTGRIPTKLIRSLEAKAREAEQLVKEGRDNGDL